MKQQIRHLFSKFLFLSIGLFPLGLSAQDIHFSQYNASPMNYNPSLTGFFNGDYRFTANYRKQWSSIPVDYITVSGAFDMKLPIKLKKDIIGAGLVISNDKAGDSGFKRSQAALSLAYIKKLKRDGSHLLSVGLQSGIIIKDFNPGELTFDKQYVGDGFNPLVDGNENFVNTQSNFFDFNLGLQWFYKFKERQAISIGSGFFHVNRPSYSFVEETVEQLHSRYAATASFQTPLNKKWDLMPSLLVSKQSSASELIFGTSLKHILPPQGGYEAAVYFGSYYRLKDALVFTLAMDYQKFNIGLSYDINLSGLKQATNGRGGLEFSLIYIIKKFNPYLHNKVFCPVFY